MRDSQINLVLELVSFALLLGFLVSMGLIALAGFTILGAEVNDVSGFSGQQLSEAERIAFSLPGYVISLLVVSIPAFLSTLGIVAIRFLLVHPEPPPWHLPGSDP